jgi:cytochrome P450
MTDQLRRDEIDTGHWVPEAIWPLVVNDKLESVDELYAGFREDNPVAWCEDWGGYYAVFGRDDIVAVARDVETFSSEVVRFSTFRPPLEADPPDHQIFRRILNPFFEPSRIAAMEPVIRGFAAEMIQPFLDGERSDFAELTEALPARVLVELLNFPAEDWKYVNEMTAPGFKGRIVAERSPATRSRAGGAMREYALAQIEQRRLDPRDDLVSALLTAEVKGRTLTDEEVVGIVVMLISAGHYTTTSAMGNSMLRLARDPLLQGRLRGEPTLISEAIEEVLRLDSSQQSMPRITTRATTLGGREIPKGTALEVVWGSANFDDPRVERPREFDLDRESRRHLAFGHGIHSCVGAPLARLEVRVLLEEVLARTTSFAVEGEVLRTAWPRFAVTQLPLAFL